MTAKPAAPTCTVACRTGARPIRKTRKTATARPAAATARTRSLMAGSKLFFSGSENPCGDAGERGHEARALEPPVVDTEPPLVFGKTETDQLGHADIRTELARSRGGEIVVLDSIADFRGDAEPLPHEKRPHREDLQFEIGPPPERHVPAVPGDPVDEKQDVTALFADNRLERVDQRFREKSRLARGFEQPKGKEAVDAFAVAGHQERPFRIARPRVGRFGSERDAIGGNQIREHVAMTPLLETIELDRLFEQRIGHGFAERRDIQSGAIFGLKI